MAKDKTPNKKSKEKKVKAPRELKPLSESQVKILASMPFLIPLLYSKQQPPGLNLSLAKYAKTQSLPKVNLLPPVVALMVKERRIKFALFLAGLCASLISMIIWTITGVAVSQANKDLANLDFQVAATQNQVNTLLPYQTYLNTVQTSIQQANTKFGLQLDYAKLLGDLQKERNVGGATFLNIVTKNIDPTIAANLPKGSSAPSPASQCGPVDNPFASIPVPIVACIAFSGSINSRTNIPALIEKLSSLPYLQDVSIIQNGQAVSGQQTPFSGSAAITKSLVLPLTGGIK